MKNAVVYIPAFLASLTGVRAGINLNSAQNVAIYWGQNSMGTLDSTGQQRLSFYCASSQVDTLILSFVTQFNGPGGYPITNFANAGNNCTTFPGTELLECPQIAEDIVTCQGLGKTILLSTGGYTYSEGGFNSTSEALQFANLMWQVFGPVSSNSSVLRPFGTAVIDGFDFDFENLVMNNMPTYANQLQSLYSTDTSKTYYMTAAPQCAYPDQADNSMLDGTVYFDAIFVQFYNNACGLIYFDPNSTTQPYFNFNTWDNWAKTVSLNRNVKVYMGVEGNVGAGAGYEPLSIVDPAVTYVSQFSSFGGVMMWDASQVWSNTGFLSSVYGTLPTATNGTTTTTISSSSSSLRQEPH